MKPTILYKNIFWLFLSTSNTETSFNKKHGEVAYQFNKHIYHPRQQRVPRLTYIVSQNSYIEQIMLNIYVYEAIRKIKHQV